MLKFVNKDPLSKGLTMAGFMVEICWRIDLYSFLEHNRQLCVAVETNELIKPV